MTRDEHILRCLAYFGKAWSIRGVLEPERFAGLCVFYQIDTESFKNTFSSMTKTKIRYYYL